MLQQKQVKSVLNKHKKRDGWFLDDYSVNPYEGCSVNCQYCYIRGSKYGENMEQGFAVKVNAAEVLDKQLRLRASKGEYGIIFVGSATDAYIHHEEKWRITEKMLQVILKHRFPVYMSTKSALITRDVELLRQIDKNAILPPDLGTRIKRGAIISVSVSTMDEYVSRSLEPGAVDPFERLKLLSQLKDEGFYVGVNAIPVLPYISDTDEELEKIISHSKKHGADYILVGGLTLFGDGPADSKTLYYKFLERQFPHLLSSYQQLYGDRFYTSRKYQEDLKKRAELICSRYQLSPAIQF